MATPNGLVGKVAFVTGGGSGIGRATALAFARKGAAVAVVDYVRESADETARLIEREGARATSIACDVSRADEVEAAVRQTVEALSRVDFAFNNAGIEQPIKPLAELDIADWDRLLAVNLGGVFLCMKHQLRVMLSQGSGVIVNTSSGAGVKGIPGQGGYAATKFGVIGLTKSAALDYAPHGIRVNAICPGIIATPMMDRFTGGTEEGGARVVGQEPVGRMGTPEEIAAAVLWMCSDRAAFLVGHALVMDGGQTA